MNQLYLRLAGALIVDCFWIGIEQFLKIRQVIQCADQKKSVCGSYSLDASQFSGVDSIFFGIHIRVFDSEHLLKRAPLLLEPEAFRPKKCHPGLSSRPVVQDREQHNKQRTDRLIDSPCPSATCETLRLQEWQSVYRGALFRLGRQRADTRTRGLQTRAVDRLS